MTEGTRSDLGFGAALEDLTTFDAVPKKAPDRAGAVAAAEATGFRSREPKPAPKAAPPARALRRRRTGRNAQFNLKAKPETIDAFCAVADANDWGLGETLEYAVTLLEQSYGKGQGRR